MDLHKLTSEDIRGFDAAKSRETEHEIRRAMVNIRMDIYTARNQHTAKIRGLRKALARLLTVRGATQVKPTAAKAAAPAAAPKAKAPKAEAKAKAPKAEKAPKAAKAEAASKAVPAPKSPKKTATKK